jgi:hypothetical protein
MISGMRRAGQAHLHASARDQGSMAGGKDSLMMLKPERPADTGTRYSYYVCTGCSVRRKGNKNAPGRGLGAV